jgi:hypothetical protein
MTFGGQTLISAGGTDIFLAKLDPEGNPLWAKQFGDATDGQTAHAVAVDSAGDVVIAGSFVGSVNFEGGAFSSAGIGEAYAAKLDGEGNHLWSKHLGGPGAEGVSAVAIDPQTRDVVVAGAFDATISFGNGTPSSTDRDFDVLSPSWRHTERRLAPRLRRQRRLGIVGSTNRRQHHRRRGFRGAIRSAARR